MAGLIKNLAINCIIILTIDRYKKKLLKKRISGNNNIVI